MTSDEIPESNKVHDQIPDCQNTLSKLFWSEHQNFLTFWKWVGQIVKCFNIFCWYLWSITGCRPLHQKCFKHRKYFDEVTIGFSTTLELLNLCLWRPLEVLRTEITGWKVIRVRPGQDSLIKWKYLWWLIQTISSIIVKLLTCSFIVVDIPMTTSKVRSLKIKNG